MIVRAKTDAVVRMNIPTLTSARRSFSMVLILLFELIEKTVHPCAMNQLRQSEIGSQKSKGAVPAIGRGSSLLGSSLTGQVAISLQALSMLRN